MNRPLRMLLIAVGLVTALLYGLAQMALAHLADRGGGRGRDGGGRSLARLRELAPVPCLAASSAAPAAHRRGGGRGSSAIAPIVPELVGIPAGYYLIGSPLIEAGRHQHFFGRYPVRAQIPEPRRSAAVDHIAKPFALSQYEVRFADWERAQDDPEWHRITGRPPRHIAFGTADFLKRPVTQIDQNDARAFARWLSARTGHTYRLPSEAEWEYAARAGTATAYYWGNRMEPGRAACFGCGGNWDAWRVGPVGLEPPNGFGLYDMAGNGWEWVADCFTPSHPASITDGSAYLDGDCEFGVFKGGSTFSPAWQVRTAMRVGPHSYNNGEGATIRLLRELP